MSIRCRRLGCGSETKFRCTTHKSAANITSLQEVQLRSETEFRCATHKSAANITSLQEVQLRQRNRISQRNTLIGSEYQFAGAGSVAAAKQNFAAGGSIASAKQNFAVGGSIASAKQNFAAQHTNQQRISILSPLFVFILPIKWNGLFGGWFRCVLILVLIYLKLVLPLPPSSAPLFIEKSAAKTASLPISAHRQRKLHNHLFLSLSLSIYIYIFSLGCLHSPLLNMNFVLEI